MEPDPSTATRGKRVAMFCTGGNPLRRRPRAISFSGWRGLHSRVSCKYHRRVPRQRAPGKAMLRLTTNATPSAKASACGLTFCQVAATLDSPARNRPAYGRGLSVATCYRSGDHQAQKNRFRERHRQVEAARKRAGCAARRGAVRTASRQGRGSCRFTRLRARRSCRNHCW